MLLVDRCVEVRSQRLEKPKLTEFLDPEFVDVPKLLRSFEEWNAPAQFIGGFRERKVWSVSLTNFSVHFFCLLIVKIVSQYANCSAFIRNQSRASNCGTNSDF